MRKIELVLVGTEYYKSCPACKSSLPITEFWKDNAKASGYSSCCKKCRKQYMAQPEMQQYKKRQATYRSKYNKLNRQKRCVGARKYYAKNAEKIRDYHRKWRALSENKKKQHAVSCIKLALKQGKLIRPAHCEINDASCYGQINAHHDDYNKPFEIRWLCRSHHIWYHRHISPQKCKYASSRVKQKEMGCTHPRS
jgi:hypothetical protein